MHEKRVTLRTFPLVSQYFTTGMLDSIKTLKRFLIVSMLSSSLPFNHKKSKKPFRQNTDRRSMIVINRRGHGLTWFLPRIRLSISSSGQSKNKTNAGSIFVCNTMFGQNKYWNVRQEISFIKIMNYAENVSHNRVRV